MTGSEIRQTVFIVRLARDSAGHVTGVVERVRTGQKERVTVVHEIGTILDAMLSRDESEEEKG